MGNQQNLPPELEALRRQIARLEGTRSGRCLTTRRPTRTRPDGREEHDSDDDLLPPRPLRLLRAPARLEATSIVPDGPPLRFSLHGCRHQVARPWGPERIETGWWRGRTLRRDYYRIETTTGRR